ncbi:hypothetical protein N9W84_00130 [bacterium]|jgi:hypothetical protein|nr:hypothetical protein [bacterium]
MLKRLVKFADLLDRKSLFKEANYIDLILQKFASIEGSMQSDDKINEIINEEADSIINNEELKEAVSDAFEGLQLGKAEDFAEMMMEKALSLYLKLSDQKLVKDVRKVDLDVETGKEITTYKDEARIVSDTGMELASRLIEKAQSENLGEKYVEFFKEIKERFEDYGPEKSDDDFGTLEDHII